jgi:hypothetical protein
VYAIPFLLSNKSYTAFYHIGQTLEEEIPQLSLTKVEGVLISHPEIDRGDENIFRSVMTDCMLR